MSHSIDIAKIANHDSRSGAGACPEVARDVQFDKFSAVEVSCAALFERWCTERNVIPLAYLMHVWPIARPTDLEIRQVGDSMAELLRGHANVLDVEDKMLINITLLSVQAVLDI
ncbi:hypothetical protein AB4Y44_24845 [Paraburkholderia sp. BR10937]|uniref:hypothetical protein n=1 Tax=Paraburkholderia sp. BR10937 TaxID=3236994 RepID=UPI0034D22EAB